MSTNPTEPIHLKHMIKQWENVRRRTRQRSPQIAMNLSLWRVVALTETPTGFIVSIQPTASAFQAHLGENDLKIIEWALSLEMNTPCFVGLLPSGSIPTPQQMMKEIQDIMPLQTLEEAPKELTEQSIRIAWGIAQIRLKQTIPLVAAYMDHCQIVNIEKSVKELTLVIQVDKQQYFSSLKAYDRYKDIEAVLAQELERACKVILTPPQS